MNGYDIIFKSGARALVYGKDEHDALNNHGVAREDLSACIDIADNLKAEKEFRHEHATLIRDVTILAEKSKRKAEYAMAKWMEDKGYMLDESGLKLLK